MNIGPVFECLLLIIKDHDIVSHRTQFVGNKRTIPAATNDDNVHRSRSSYNKIL